MALRKSTLAAEALRQLNGIHEMAEENRQAFGNADAAATLQHAARSANNYIKAIRDFDAALLPEWLTGNARYFKTIGWSA